MNFKEIALLLSLFLILILIILSQTNESFFEGRINEIYFSSEKTTIFLEKFEEPFVVFEMETLLSKGDFIRIFGNEEHYRGKKQVLVDKILKIPH